MAVRRTSWLGASGTLLAVLLGSCLASGPSVAEDQRQPVTRPARPASAPAPAPAPAPRPAIELERTQARQGDLLRGRIIPANGRLMLDGEAVAVASDGRFVIGFDRDAPGTARLVLTPPRGAAVEQALVVEPANWSIQHVDAPMRGSARSDADFERRRPGELAQMGRARATVVESDGWRQRFVWPVTGRISGVFGSQRVYRGTPGSYHNGVDIAAGAGTPYVAPADGVVILAATTPFTLEGYLLMIDHGGGLSSTFMHSSRLDVRTGDVVRQGQRLGTVGATGRVTGPHMHWAMRWRGRKIDAARVAGPMPAPVRPATDSRR